MNRIKVIKFCGECPELGFNKCHELENFDENYCIITGNGVKLDSIPENCPLPTEVRDLNDEMEKRKREIRQYRLLYNSKHGKF